MSFKKYLSRGAGALTFAVAVTFSAGSASAQGTAPSDATPLILEGDLEIVHIDQFDQGKSRFGYFILPEDGDSAAAIELEFARGAPKSLKPGSRINIKGKAKGRKFWVEDILEVTEEDDLSLAPATGDPSAAVEDPHSTLVMLVNIAGTSSWTTSHMTDSANVMYRDFYSVDAIYTEASHGKFGFPESHGVIAQPFSVNKIDGCPLYSYASAADTEVQKQGIDPNSFRHKIYIIPGGAVSDCNWLAVGNLGSYGSTATYRSWSTRIDASALGHELGHNAGWHHAATDGNNNGYDASESTDAEYADTSDLMGYCCTEKKFNAVHTDQIGWLQEGAALSVTGAGAYTLAPLGTDPAVDDNPQVLKIDRDGSGNVYYISYRQKTSRDGLLSSSYVGGLSIHYGRPNGNWSYLVKNLTDTDNLFEDPAIGLTVQQSWHDAAGVGLTVSFDSCVTAPPSVSIAPNSQVMGDSYLTTGANYSVTVHNNDLTGCDAASFTLSADPWTLSSTSVPLDPGQSSDSIALSVSGALPDGTTNIVATAERGSDSGSGSASLTLDTTPPSAPFAAAAQSKKVRGSYEIQVSWSAADDGQGSGVSRYRLVRDGTFDLGTTSALKFVDSAGDGSVSHSYEIYAIDEVGNVSLPAVADYTPGSGGGGKGGGKGNGKKK